MLDFRPMVAAALAFVLLVMFAAPVLAVEYNVGVSAGQYVKYGNFYVLNIPAEYDWEKAEVTAVSGEGVTLLTTLGNTRTEHPFQIWESLYIILKMA